MKRLALQRQWQQRPHRLVIRGAGIFELECQHEAGIGNERQGVPLIGHDRLQRRETALQFLPQPRLRGGAQFGGVHEPYPRRIQFTPEPAPERLLPVHLRFDRQLQTLQFLRRGKSVGAQHGITITALLAQIPHADHIEFIEI